MPPTPRDRPGRLPNPLVIRGGTWILAVPFHRILSQIERANEDARSVSFRTHLRERQPR